MQPRAMATKNISNDSLKNQIDEGPQSFTLFECENLAFRKKPHSIPSLNFIEKTLDYHAGYTQSSSIRSSIDSISCQCNNVHSLSSSFNQIPLSIYLGALSRGQMRTTTRSDDFLLYSTLDVLCMWPLAT